MAILITGAAGFVALNVAEYLLTAGRDVIGLDRIALPERARRSFAALPGRFTLIGGSILSAADLTRALTSAPIEAVIHCAVITAGSAREKADPETIVAVNIQGAVATLTAAARRGVPRFVYPSSGAIYGAAARDVPLIDEDTVVPTPVTLYGLTKRAAETLLPRVAETQGIGFAAARLGSVYGPWEYATGVRDTLSPMLQVLECARRGEEAVLAPAWRGDFIFSRDVADGLVRLADAPALSRVVYNLGSGRLGSAATWCEALSQLVPDVHWHHAAPDEPANIDSHTGFHRGPMAIGKIARDTGYVPQWNFAAAAREWLAWRH
ncbi:MAG: NAD(P)-dependent oxidoreductase [Acetobacteraceae bacterium]|jgi:nucleoside-diphosphate-sugar epimerase